ncbi:MAG: DNA recombination protein RmuC [Phycisphaerae bacterium]|nr:DNA recombination protein RmuC [Phycisphaerae bacterium]
MIDVMSLVLGLFAGAIVAGVVAWLVAKAKAASQIASIDALRHAVEARLDEQITARTGVDEALAIERAARSTAEQAVARHQAEAAAERRNLEEQRRLLDDARAQLTNVFRAVGSEELSRVQKELVERSSSQHAEQQKLAAVELEQRRQLIDASLKPIEQLLVQQRTAIGELEQRRVAAYASIETQIKGMLSATDAIRLEAGKLSTAMKRSDARGRWGEVALKNLVEMAGMTEHVDFETQVHVTGSDGAQRPDLVVRLPGGGSVVVDAKVPLEHYLAAQEADADVSARMIDHATAVRRHVDALSAKAYWNQFERTPSYVVMFMPVESALAAAFVARPDLQEYALRSRVILASSGIFLALLQTVSLFWRQEQLALNARQISEAGATLYERISVFAGHLNKVGDALGNLNKHYNSAIGSYESRVVPSTRVLRELKVTTAAELTTPALIESVPRRLESDELTRTDG